MKKLISLLVAVVMVMGLATVAFAAEPTDAGDHTINAAADIPTTITLAAGETATYTLVGGPNGDPAAEAAWSVFGKMVELTSDKPGCLWLVPGMWGNDLADWNGFTASGYLEGHPMMGSITFAVENTGTETATYTLAVLAEPGTIGNPEPLDVEWGNYPYMSDAHEGEFYYTYTAGATAEVLTISDVSVIYNTMNMDNINFNIILTREDNSEASLWIDGEYADELSVALAAGETVSVMVRAQENEATYNPPSVEFKAAVAEAPAGTDRTPIEVSMIGDYTVEGDEVWFAVNSMLAGNIVVVNGDDAVLVVGEDVIPAVDGIATAVLNGNGAVIPVCVKNGDDMIIVPAPTEISAAGDYEATVAAGAEVEYAVNSKLAGAVLTVKGEGAYIYMNGTKYTAVDGVATAVLDGEGATIAVKIGNEGTANGEYELNIAYAPTVITAAGDYTATVAGGAEVEYVINSKLDGATVTVTGEGAYLIVDGKKVEGNSVVLKAEAATISLVVGNSGNASVEYTINVAVAGNAATGDAGIIGAVVTLAASAIGGVAVVAKKKEF